VSAFSSEVEAFRAYGRAFPDGAVLLLDTYDTAAAAHKAVEVARELAADGHRLAGVRLDSGDLTALSREVRRILDEGGFRDVRIVVSGGLDEHDIAALLEAGAPIDMFGIGTRLNVSADAPSLDMVYKLVRLNGRDLLKLSPDKRTWVGGKQVVRRHGPDGLLAGDALALEEEPVPNGATGLLEPVMRGGELLRPHPSMVAMRAYCAEQLAALPERLRRLREPARYEAAPSEALKLRQEAAVRAVGGARTGDPSS
jgi:nicotinate phosphoribosyltransferase